MQKIAILGTGAIGASVGLDLIEAGHDVILIDQWPAHVDAMKQNGLFVKMPGSEHQQAVKAYHLNEIYTLKESGGWEFGSGRLGCRSCSHQVGGQTGLHFRHVGLEL